MTLSGALAGMAGANEVLGVNHNLAMAFSSGYGFDSIALALLGNSHPVGVVLAALLFGALRNGATRMQLVAGIPIDIISILQALILIFIAAPAIIRTDLPPARAGGRPKKWCRCGAGEEVGHGDDRTAAAATDLVSPTRQRVMGIIFLALAFLFWFAFVRSLPAGVITTFGTDARRVGRQAAAAIGTCRLRRRFCVLAVLAAVVGGIQLARRLRTRTNLVLGLVVGALRLRLPRLGGGGEIAQPGRPAERDALCRPCRSPWARSRASCASGPGWSTSPSKA